MFAIFLILFGVLVAGNESDTKLLSDWNDTSLLWGPYRPNLYFGMRPRVPDSLIIGLMWSTENDVMNAMKSIRHSCEQDEGMAHYGWLAYDSREGGVETVNDTVNGIDLSFHLAKINKDNRGQWGVRVRGIPKFRSYKSTMIVYLGIEDAHAHTKCKMNAVDVVCDGIVGGLEHFKLRIPGAELHTKVYSRTVPVEDVWQAKSILKNQMRDDRITDQSVRENMHFIQQSFDGDFEFDVLFSEMTTELITQHIQDAQLLFDARFQSVYPPQAPFQDAQYAKFSKSLISNLMGGIGYFHGKSKVDVSHAPEYEEVKEDYWEAAAIAQSRAIIEDSGPYQLFSTVPSRPFFPRGFLWDEGFHLLLIMDWDMDLALDILCSWLDLMDEDGWIAREQILGSEARSKVPLKFQTQYPHYANPPTLFLVIRAYIAILNGKPYHGRPGQRDYNLEVIYSKLKTHYDWFRRTQAGSPHGYRWRGQTPQHILTSGLDDYPRAKPHPENLHLDALCWVGVMSTTLDEFAKFIGAGDKFPDLGSSVDEIHWSEINQAYCDTSICHIGYISIFPLLVGLNVTHVGAMLDVMDELWSPFGLRSLSPKDKHYGTDENYWRGPVWINFNYMALERLLELALQGPHQTRARRMYTELRFNLVSTVFDSWRQTGFAWEQYNAETGKGQRTQHFTGWTSLIVKVMAMPDLQDRPVVRDREIDYRVMVMVLMLITVLVYLWYRRRVLGRRLRWAQIAHTL